MLSGDKVSEWGVEDIQGVGRGFLSPIPSLHHILIVEGYPCGGRLARGKGHTALILALLPTVHQALSLGLSSQF